MIIREIQKHSSITIDIINALIKEYDDKFQKEEKSYIIHLNDLHYQDSLSRIKLSSLGRGIPVPQLNDLIRDKIRTVSLKHQTNLQEIDERIKMLQKIKTIFIEIYPESPLISPRLSTFIRSNSFSKKSTKIEINARTALDEIMDNWNISL